MQESYFDRNRLFAETRSVWEWCSAALRSGWLSHARHRNDCLLGIAYGVDRWHARAGISMYDIPDIYGKIEGLLLDRTGLSVWWRYQPASLLEMALGSFTPGLSLAEEMETIRAKWEIDPVLDAIAKITLQREKACGEDWRHKAYHPVANLTRFERHIEGLRNELEALFLKNEALLNTMARNILAQGWEKGYLPAACTVRKTPEGLINKAARFKLWLFTQEALDQGMEGELLARHVASRFDRLLSPHVREEMQRAGHTIEDVFDDFLRWDIHKSRQEILGESGPLSLHRQG